MAKAIGSKDLERDLKKALRNVGKQCRARLESPTDSWNEKPVFTVREFEDSGDLVEEIQTDNDKYYWLNEGTSTRFATMTKGFVAKTKTGSFASGSGQGGLAYVNKNIPRRGITAREWTDLAAVEFEAILQKAIEDVLGNNSGRLFALTGKYSKYVIDE